jgi:hypothetical protein
MMGFMSDKWRLSADPAPIRDLQPEMSRVSGFNQG